MTSDSPTIAAVITAPGEAGVSIVRVSGLDALSIADRLFRCAPPLPSDRPEYTFVYGKIFDGQVELDEGLLLIFRAPHSYTAEDVVKLRGSFPIDYTHARRGAERDQREDQRDPAAVDPHHAAG